MAVMSSSSRAVLLVVLVTALPGLRAQEPAKDLSDLAAVAATAWSGMDASAYQGLVRRSRQDVQVALAPLTATLPRNPQGGLDGPAVKYALHHFFVRHAAWHVRGLDPEGQRWNTTSLSEVEVLSKLPAALHHALARRLVTGGFSEGDVAVLALCIMQLIHKRNMEQLVKTYAFVNHSTASALELEHAISAVEWYMAAFVLDHDIGKGMNTLFGEVTRESFDQQMTLTYPRWPQLAQLVRQEVTAVHSAQGGGSLGFAAVELARERVDERFGMWQTPECRELKAVLMAREDKGSGRVRLADFYKAGLDDNVHFVESEPWLRQLGALEESSSGEPRVLIENYISGASNSIGSTPFHDVRCISECEALYEQLERHVAAPAASPVEIAAFVAGLPSATVSSPRALSTVQLQRLNAIAEQDGGQVPIAGRMLALWMHHEYPRECPFPHRSGTTTPKTFAELLAKPEAVPMASPQVMARLASRKVRKDAPVQTVPWQPAEELPVELPPRALAVGLLQVQLAVCLGVFALTSRGLLRVGRKSVAARGCRNKSDSSGPHFLV